VYSLCLIDMPHITIPDELPGIRGLMAFRPETARVLNELVDVLLRQPNTLAPGERELIATYVSSENDCFYCQTIHGAIAARDHDDDEALVAQVKRNFSSAPISDKLKALLTIAGQVRKAGRESLQTPLNTPASVAPRIRKSMTPYLLRPPSACSTVMWMDLQPWLRKTPNSTGSAPRRSFAMDTRT
jgi:AhpD family alkylhydroperoxidase